MSDASLIVELGLISSQFTKGLNEAKEKLESFGKTAALVAGAFAAFEIGKDIFEGISHQLEQASERADGLFKNITKLGVGAQEFQALTFAAKEFGLSSDQVATSIGLLQKNIGAASFNSGGTQAKAIQALGLNVKELLQLDGAQQFQKISEALGKVNNQAQQTALGTALMGRSFRESIGFINSNIPETISEYQKLGVALTEGQLASTHQLEEQKHVMSTLFSGFFDQVGADLAPSFIKIYQYINKTIEGMGGINVIAKKVADGLISGFTGLYNVLDRVYQIYQKLKEFGETGVQLGKQAYDSANTTLTKYLPSSFSDQSIIGSVSDQIDRVKESYNYFSGKPGATPYNPNSGNLGGASTIPSITQYQKEFSEAANVTASIIPYFKDFSTVTKKASSQLLDLASAAKKSKEDMFSKAFDNNKGVSDQISRIVNNSGQLPQAKSDEFDKTAGQLIQDVKGGEKLDSGSVKTTLNYLKGIANGEYDTGDFTDHSAQQTAIKELEKYLNKIGKNMDGKESKVQVTITPSPYFTTVVKAQAIDAARDLASQEARGVTN